MCSAITHRLLIQDRGRPPVGCCANVSHRSSQNSCSEEAHRQTRHTDVQTHSSCFEAVVATTRILVACPRCNSSSPEQNSASKTEEPRGETGLSECSGLQLEYRTFRKVTCDNGSHTHSLTPAPIASPRLCLAQEKNETAQNHTMCVNALREPRTSVSR